MAGFSGTNLQKNGRFHRKFVEISGVNFAERQLVKKQQISWEFSGQILLETQSDRFYTDLMNVFK